MRSVVFGLAMSVMAALPMGCASLREPLDSIPPPEAGAGPTGNHTSAGKLLYEKGLGVSQNEGRAAALYEKACAAGAPRGCARLGHLYEIGRGVDPDEGRAAELYKTACEGGLMESCAELGVLYVLGLGVSRDTRQAMVLFNRACAKGVAVACTRFANLLQNGAWERGNGGFTARAEPHGPQPAGPRVQLDARIEMKPFAPGPFASLAAELSGGAFSAAVTLIVWTPGALRLEGRCYTWTGPVRLYAGLGASFLLPVVGARGAVGLDVEPLERLHLLSEVAYERFFNPSAGSAADALLFSLGAGWSL